MKNSKVSFLVVAFITIFSLTACNAKENNEKEINSSVSNIGLDAKDILSKMSIDEKLALLSGEPSNPVNLKFPVRGVGGYVNGVANKNVDLPALKFADGPAGVRLAQNTTAWPIGTLLASTWDKSLVTEVGKAMGSEALEYGVDVLLAPGMNLHRNPLAGRNFEYYSEDPLLTGKIASSMVTGIQSNGVGATLKHFYGNESETNRNYLVVITDPRTSREIYLRGFEIAVKESKPWAVMSSYNLINGQFTSQRKDLLEDILRGEWGFNGLVMSDWYSSDIQRDRSSGAKQISAGNDLIMPGSVFNLLKNSYNNGELSLDDINKSALRVIDLALKTPSGRGYKPTGNVDKNANAQLAKRAGQEGMVLLKNIEKTLPIEASSSVALFGVSQFITYKGGSGSGNVSSSYVVNIADGLESKFNLNQELKSFYNNFVEANKTSVQDGFAGIPIYSVEEASVSQNIGFKELIVEAAENDSNAVIAISREAGEGIDRSPSRGYYLLDDNELELISVVSSEFHSRGKKVTVVLNVDGVVDTSEWSNSVDSILLAYMGGQETGNQIGSILSGEVNPSGKLTQTFPKAYKDNPSAIVFPGIDANGDRYPDYMLNNEGIYVGYRYYSTFNVDVSYPFGYGLSYTEFEFSEKNIKENSLVNGSDGKIVISTKVTNTGEVEGKEVVQLYVNSPEVLLDKPVIELKGFNKTDSLNSKESEIIDIEVSAHELASFDPNRSMWILEPGEYKFYLSNSSDISGVEPITFTLNKEVIVEESTSSLLLPEGITNKDFINVSK